jgi:putative NIF3 family GTP cyclohydrolase 1 type 2
LDIKISTVAICAGSGGSVLGPVIDADLLFTGELQHHEALAAIERGQSVVALFHSNTERGFLHGVLRDQLKSKLKEEWNLVRLEEAKEQDVAKQMKDALDDQEVNVAVSERDRDPFGLVILNA